MKVSLCTSTVIVLVLACQPLQGQSITRENEITKHVRLFANQIVQRVYELRQQDNTVLVMDFTDLRRDARPLKQVQYAISVRAACIQHKNGTLLERGLRNRGNNGKRS